MRNLGFAQQFYGPPYQQPPLQYGWMPPGPAFPQPQPPQSLASISTGTSAPSAPSTVPDDDEPYEPDGDSSFLTFEIL